MNPPEPKTIIGKIGELLVQLRLLQYEVEAAPPLTDSGNDLIAVKNSLFRAIQVKTTTQGRFDSKHIVLDRKYHLLALVSLKKGKDDQYDLHQSQIYLIDRETINREGNTCLTGSGLPHQEFELNKNHVEEIFPNVTS